MLAPIVLFAYKRPNELKETLAALRKNYLASESNLFVFVDGPKRRSDVEKVNEVKKNLVDVKGFKSVTVMISNQNIGCADSIIKGVTKIIKEYKKIIVLEDDIVTTPNFLNYMNQNLEMYANNKEVFTIGGYSFDLKANENNTKDVYFIERSCAWGWATWEDRWEQIDWDVKDYKNFIRNKNEKRQFNENGSDRVDMLRKTMEKKIDAWDIRLCYTQFLKKAKTVYPVISKVENIGFYSNDGVNTNVYNRYKTKLDSGEKKVFILPEDVYVDEKVRKEFVKNFSVQVRIINKIRTVIGIR